MPGTPSGRRSEPPSQQRVRAKVNFLRWDQVIRLQAKIKNPL
jgi:hypothetical protein